MIAAAPFLFCMHAVGFAHLVQKHMENARGPLKKEGDHEHFYCKTALGLVRSGSRNESIHMPVPGLFFHLRFRVSKSLCLYSNKA